MILIINGVPNAGKTTVCKELMHRRENLAHLEIDKLTSMVPWMPLSRSIGLAFRQAGDLLPSFVECGLDVVIDYPLDLFWYGELLKATKSLNVPVHTITLKPPLEVVLQDRGTREISPGLQARISELYETDMNDPSIGTFIDNSGETPEQTVERIISLIDN